MVAGAFALGSAAADGGMDVVGAVRVLGTIVFGLTGHIAIAGLATAAVGAAIASDYFSTVSPLCLGC